MKRLFAIILFCGHTHLALAQWVLQPPVTTANLWDVKFSDRNTGWILGQYYTWNGSVGNFAYKPVILRTTDAGSTWIEQTLENCVLWRFAFVNRSTGWAVGNTRSRSGLICRTVDGGVTWTMADSSAQRSTYTALAFADSLHGCIGGYNDTTGIILRTTDGGVTWNNTYDTTFRPYDVNDFFFLDAASGWGVGEYGGIFRTTDGGKTWKQVFKAPDPRSPSSFSPLRRIRFTDALHGCAVGGISGCETKVWTSDGGVSWNVVDSVFGSSLHGLFMLNASVGWTVGGANAGLTIQKTTDGGKTWIKQQFPPLGSRVSYFNDVTFVTAAEGWIVADGGVVLKTTTGGMPATGIVANQKHGKDRENQLSQNYPNPFNPTTTITILLPAASFVSLKVFDALGKEVSVLLSEELPAGMHSRQWNASGFPSGAYFYRLQAGLFMETRRLVLLR